MRRGRLGGEDVVEEVERAEAEDDDEEPAMVR